MVRVGECDSYPGMAPELLSSRNGCGYSARNTTREDVAPHAEDCPTEAHMRMGGAVGGVEYLAEQRQHIVLTTWDRQTGSLVCSSPGAGTIRC
jgi:hypothetical protein